MLNVFFLFNYKASFLIPAKRKSPLHGQHMWGKCSQQPVPTYPLRYLTWWIRTEPLPQCDSTCSVWRTFVPSLRKRTTTIQVYWKNTSLYLCRFIYIVCVLFLLMLLSGFRSFLACLWHLQMGFFTSIMWIHRMEASVSLFKSTGVYILVGCTGYKYGRKSSF